MASNKKMTMIPINGDWKKQQKKKYIIGWIGN